MVRAFSTFVTAFKCQQNLIPIANELQRPTPMRILLVSGLSILLAFPPLIAVISSQGFRYGLGNRELGGGALPEWGKRAERAHLNLLANLPAFAVVVLVAALAGVSNEVTEVGAQQFFWARVAHAVIYVAGIPYIRAIAFGVSLGGLFAIAGELLSAWSVAG